MFLEIEILSVENGCLLWGLKHYHSAEFLQKTNTGRILEWDQGESKTQRKARSKVCWPTSDTNTEVESQR